jgi:hypothetical protein
MTLKGEYDAFGGTMPEERTSLALLEPKREEESANEKKTDAARRTKRARRSKKTKLQTPRTRKPPDMSLEEWQIALRREFGSSQNFTMKNLSHEPIFSEFIVENPDTGGRYRVAIRGDQPGTNYCSCCDFSINTLGTCKHIEFALAKLKRKRGAKKAFTQGFNPPYSTVSLRYGMKREVVFQAGSECSSQLKAIARDYFGKNGILKPDKFSLFDEFLRKASLVPHELRCYEDAIQHIVHVRDQATLRDTVDRAFADGEESAAFNELLKVPLYPYQRKGALFAARAGRSIIADEMGLGKTIQAIAACEILA